MKERVFDAFMKESIQLFLMLFSLTVSSIKFQKNVDFITVANRFRFITNYSPALSHYLISFTKCFARKIQANIFSRFYYFRFDATAMSKFQRVIAQKKIIPK